MSIETVNLIIHNNDNIIIETYDDNGKLVQRKTHYCYIPHYNNVLGGDCTIIQIENATGKIIGWTPVKSLTDEIDAKGG